MGLIRQVGKAVFATADWFLPNPEGPRILIYHQVGAGLGRQMEVTTEDFVWQLDWLVANREVVDLDTAIARWDEDKADQLCVLTFDDGYRDTFTAAFPLMAERRLPFTVYLATEMIETGRQSSEDSEPLHWDEIGTMMRSGLLTVGSHTHSHGDLRRAEEYEVLSELETADSIIESRLGVNPGHFAYPFGYWGAVAHRLVSGRYRSAVLGAPVSRSSFDPHRLHRFPVQRSDGTRWFPSRLVGGLMMEEKARRRMRGYEGP